MNPPSRDLSLEVRAADPRAIPPRGPGDRPPEAPLRELRAAGPAQSRPAQSRLAEAKPAEASAAGVGAASVELSPLGEGPPDRGPSEGRHPEGRHVDELAVRACRGDARAFETLVDVLATPLLRFVTGVMAGDIHAAHDVVQETFLVAWSGIREIQVPEQFRAWIFRVAHRRAVSWLRRRGPHGAPFVGLDQVFSSGEVAPRGWGRAHAPADLSADVPSPRVAEEPAPRLRQVLGSMPPRYAAPLTLYYLESLGLKETALVLNVPLSTLKMRLYRGRGMLRRRLLAVEPWVRHPARKTARPLGAPLGPPLAGGRAAHADGPPLRSRRTLP